MSRLVAPDVHRNSTSGRTTASVQLICAAPSTGTQCRSVRKEECMKQEWTELRGWSRVSAEQWPVEGIRPSYRWRVFPPLNWRALHPEGVVGCSTPVAESSSKAEWVRHFLDVTCAKASFIIYNSYIEVLVCNFMYKKLEICILNKYVKHKVDFTLWYFRISSTSVCIFYNIHIQCSHLRITLLLTNHFN